MDTAVGSILSSNVIHSAVDISLYINSTFVCCALMLYIFRPTVLYM
jgi:hypothetical protein